MIKRVGAALLLSTLSGHAVLAADGESLFNGSCALCHQKGGAGSIGLAPPLTDKPLWNRLGGRAPTYLAGVMLAGMSGTIEVLGTKYSALVMPPQSQMTDDELAAIGNYVLSTLNDCRAELLTSAVATLRSAPLSHAKLRELRSAGN
jgi:mono/diheme cytochrome c family protein